MAIFRDNRETSITVDDEIDLLTISPNNDIVVGSSGKTIFLWDIQHSRLLLAITGHRSNILGAVLSPDERSLASWSSDGMLMIWGLPFPMEEKISMDGLAKQARDQLIGKWQESDKDRGFHIHITSSNISGDLTADWEGRWIAPGQGSETDLGHLSLFDASGVTVLDWAITDAPRINAIQFSSDGRNLVASEEGGAGLIIPISRPRRGINYKMAYEGVRFIGGGIEFTESFFLSKELVMPLPPNFSSVLLAQKISPPLLPDAIKWLQGNLRRPTQKPE